MSTPLNPIAGLRDCAECGKEVVVRKGKNALHYSCLYCTHNSFAQTGGMTNKKWTKGMRPHGSAEDDDEPQDPQVPESKPPAMPRQPASVFNPGL